MVPNYMLDNPFKNDPVINFSGSAPGLFSISITTGCCGNMFLTITSKVIKLC